MAMSSIIEAIEAALRNSEPLAPPVSLSDSPLAVVMVLIREGSEPTLILTQRTSNLSSHGGEVAWPGGRVDPEDATPWSACLRETFEEIGIPTQVPRLLGVLPGEVSKFGLWVTPYVCTIDEDQPLLPNPDEVASVFEVPWRWLNAHPPREVERLDRHGQTQWAPVYQYEGYRIWGLTAMILASLLRVCRGP
jgi:8-oxo-dGTP pyrophosphatase MutT (NUDIX family)